MVLLKKYEGQNSYEKKNIGRKGAYILSPTPLSVTHILLAVNRTCESVCACQYFLLSFNANLVFATVLRVDKREVNGRDDLT